MSCAHTKEDVCGVCIQALITDPEFREKAMRDFWPQEVARLQSQLEAAKRENAALREGEKQWYDKLQAADESIATLTAENERLREQRPHLIPEPECTCYEFIGGHQQGCPMYGMTPEGIRKWQDDYSTQCHEIEETIQWKNLVESHDRLTASIASEKERADSNFESCERVKQKFSEATASLAEVTKERDALLRGIDEHNKLQDRLTALQNSDTPK